MKKFAIALLLLAMSAGIADAGPLRNLVHRVATFPARVVEEVRPVRRTAGFVGNVVTSPVWVGSGQNAPYQGYGFAPVQQSGSSCSSCQGGNCRVR